MRSGPFNRRRSPPTFRSIPAASRPARKMKFRDRGQSTVGKANLTRWSTSSPSVLPTSKLCASRCSEAELHRTRRSKSSERWRSSIKPWPGTAGPKKTPSESELLLTKESTGPRSSASSATRTEYGLSQPINDELYVPADQSGFSGNLIVRTAIDPMSLSPLVRAAIHKVDPQLAIDRVNTIESFEHDTIASPRVTAILLGLFALLALVISAGGIAAVMALAVSQRTHELGIRMALGASRDSILQMVLRQGLSLAFAGTGLGIVGAIALTRLLASLLYATSPTDAPTFLAVSALFFAIAAVACWVPARQVTGIDPMIALTPGVIRHAKHFTCS